MQLSIYFQVRHPDCVYSVLFYMILKSFVYSKKRQSSPVTGLEWPRGFQEVKVPRIHDNGTGWW